MRGEYTRTLIWIGPTFDGQACAVDQLRRDGDAWTACGNKFEWSYVQMGEVTCPACLLAVGDEGLYDTIRRREIVK